MLSSKQPAERINSINTQGLKPGGRSEGHTASAAWLEFPWCCGMEPSGIRIFGPKCKKLATVGTRGLHGTALAPRMTRLTKGRSGAEGHFTPYWAKHRHQPLVMMVMIIIPSTIISQCDDGDDVNLSTIINHSLAEYLQPAKQMIQFGASHCGKAKLRSS